VVRVRHPSRDPADFHARFGAAIAAQGLFVPAARSRPAGTRVELILELRDGSAVRGEALAVDGARDASGSGVTFRFVTLSEGSVPLEPPRPREAPSSAAPAAPPLQEPLGAPEQRDPLPGAEVVEEGTGISAEETIDVPLRRDVVELRGATEELERQRGAALRHRRVRIAAAAAAAAAVAALGAYLVLLRQAEQQLDAHVASADERLADGRLAGGGDSALDHLVAARGRRPDDPRVRERLRLVADKLEELADRAFARGDYAEAAVHLTAASQAEPARRRIHVRLGEIARMRGRPPQDRAEPSTAPGTPSSAGGRTVAPPE
jgi:hypothetical protein